MITRQVRGRVGCAGRRAGTRRRAEAEGAAVATEPEVASGTCPSVAVGDGGRRAGRSGTGGFCGAGARA